MPASREGQGMGLVSSRCSAKHLLNEKQMKVGRRKPWWPEGVLPHAALGGWGGSISTSDWSTGGLAVLGPLSQCPRRSQPVDPSDHSQFLSRRKTLDYPGIHCSEKWACHPAYPSCQQNPPHSQATSLPIQETLPQGLGSLLGMWWARTLLAFRSEWSGLSPKENRQTKVGPAW